MGVTVSYGGQGIVPAPLISIQRTTLQTKNRTYPIGYTYNIILRGVLLPTQGGIIYTDSKKDNLKTWFRKDGGRFVISCDGTDVMVCFPRVRSISFDESNNNWVESIPYTVELEYDYDDVNEHPTQYESLPYLPDENPPCIEDYNEEWQFEFIQERRYFSWDLSAVVDKQGGYDYTTKDSNNFWEARATHNISIRGKHTFEDSIVSGVPEKWSWGIEKTAIQNAMDYMTGVLGITGQDTYESNYTHALSGWTNLTLPHVSSAWEVWDHFRSHTVNETDGTINLSESWIILGNNSGITGSPKKAMAEDFSIEIRQSLDNGLVSVGINGMIQGMEERKYTGLNAFTPTNTTGTAYIHAQSGWGVIQNRVFPRAQYVYEQSFARKLNPTPITKTIGHNPSKGTISYALEFNDRPCSFITGALSENFTIVDNNPADVFARLPVLGRAAGPVLQAINTVTEATRDITIEAVMPLPTGCSNVSGLDLYKPTTNVKNLLCQFETQLTSTYNQVFKNSDTENWNPLSGRYSRSVSWTYQDCSGAPSTSMC